MPLWWGKPTVHESLVDVRDSQFGQGDGENHEQPQNVA
jgi:hypothetical protein